jgi:hypothetical protein
VGFADPGDLTDYLGDKIEYITVIPGIHLDADIGIAGGIGKVTDGFIGSQGVGNINQPGGFHLDEHIRADNKSKRHCVDIAAHRDNPVLDEPFNPVPNGSLGNITDPGGDL